MDEVMEAPSVRHNTAHWEDHFNVTSGETINVGPRMAAKFLGANFLNRTHRTPHSETLARDMIAGKWKYNGQPMHLDWYGHLLDGQHRCYAIVETGFVVKAPVYVGCDPALKGTIDTGIARSFADSLKMDGEVHYNFLAASTRLYNNYLIHKHFDPRRRNKASIAELYTVLGKNPRLRKSVNEIVGGYRKLAQYGSKSLFSALFYIFSQKDAEMTTNFFSAFDSGADLSSSSPIHVLRERIMNERLKVKAGSLGVPWVSAVTVKAWNAVREDRRYRSIGGLRHDAAKQEFPEIL